MNTLRQALFLAIAVTCLFSLSDASQSTAIIIAEPRSEVSVLKLSTRGQVKLSNGRTGAFRIYTSTDGIKGTVTYAQFASADDAKQQLKEWLMLAQRVTSKELKTDKAGGVIGDRIVATRREPTIGKPEFLIIRRDERWCFFIQSLSLSVAQQVENEIGE